MKIGCWQICYQFFHYPLPPKVTSSLIELPGELSVILLTSGGYAFTMRFFFFFINLFGICSWFSHQIFAFCDFQFYLTEKLGSLYLRLVETLTEINCQRRSHQKSLFICSTIDVQYCKTHPLKFFLNRKFFFIGCIFTL